jgi:hypothetical protein
MGNQATMHIRKCTPGVTECANIAEWSPDVVIETVNRAQNPTAASSCGRPALNGFVRKTFENPTLAINRATGRVHVAYSFRSTATGPDDSDIRYVVLRPNLTTAIGPVQLNVDGTQTDQWRPFLSVTSWTSPAVAVAWYSRQLDTTGNLMFDVFKRVSRDDGLTFGAEERVTSVSSGIPPLLPYFDPMDIVSCYMSDYETMDADDGNFYIGWSDNRLMAGGIPDPDIRFAKQKENRPPDAQCQDVSADADSSCQAAVSAEQIDNGSSDPDGDPLTFTLDPPGPFSEGPTAVELTVTDVDGASDTCTATVTVDDVTRPTIAAAPDIEVECTSPGGEVVTYSTPIASDNCDPAPEVICTPPSGSTFPSGDTTVTCRATDASGHFADTSFTVSVVDETPPTITSVTASPNVLWPPNHKMVPVSVGVSVSDLCDSAPVCRIVSVRSNEEVNGRGDGDTAPDWEFIPGTLTANLRAERSGGGSGRVYTIGVRCTDGSGNRSSKSTTTVRVPHNRRRN